MAGEVIEQRIRAIDEATGPINAVVRSADGLERSAESVENLGEAGGDAESSLRALAGVVGMVNPELAGLINVVAEVGGGMEGLAKGGQLLSSTLGGVGLAAGALGLALAAGVAGWALYTEYQERAANAGGEVTRMFREQQAAAERATQAIIANAQALQQAGASMDAAALEAAVLRGELAPEEAATLGRVETFRGQRAGTEQGLQDLVSGLEGQLAAFDKATSTLNFEALAKIQQETGFESRSDLEQQLNLASQTLREFQDETAQGVASLNELGEMQLRQRQQREADQAAQQGAAEAARRKAEADREAEQAARDLAAAEAEAAAEAARLAQQQALDYAAMQQAAQQQLTLQVQADSLLGSIAALDPALTAQEAAYQRQIAQLNELSSALGQAALAGRVTADELALGLQTIEEARTAAEAGRTGAVGVGGQDGGAAVLSGLEGALSGSLTAALAPALSALGPEGAIVAAVLGLLEQGPEQVKAVLMSLSTVIPTAIAPALATLVEMIPTFTVDLINGLITALPDLLIAVLVYAGPILAIQVAAALLAATPEIITGLAVALGEVAADLPELLFSTAALPFAVTRGLVQAIPEMIKAFREMNLVADFKEAVREAFQDALDTIRPDKGGMGEFSVELKDHGRPIAKMIARAQKTRGGGVRNG